MSEDTYPQQLALDFSTVPYGTCHCGCGEKTRISPETDPRKGAIRGQPRRFLQGHQCRSAPMEYVEEDRGYSTPCLIWQRFCKPDNHYGVTRYQGKKRLAHIVVWEKVHGPVPLGLCVCHHCDIPSCGRLDHLFLGTHQENMDDMARKGRRASGDRSGARLHPERLARGTRNGRYTHPETTKRGEAHPHRVLTEDYVREIRKIYTLGGVSYQTLGIKYGVSDKSIEAVVRGITWKHVA